MKKTLQIAITSIPEAGKDLSLDLGKEWFARWHDRGPGTGILGRGHHRIGAPGPARPGHPGAGAA